MATTYTYLSILPLFLVLLQPFLFVLGSKGHLDRCPPYELLFPCYCNSIPKYNSEEGIKKECRGAQAVVHNSARCLAPVITCIGDHLDERSTTSALVNIGRIFANVTANTVNPVLRKFDWLYLIDGRLKYLEAEALAGGLNFRNIYIKSAPALQVINETAFGGAENIYTEAIFINASSLSDVPRLRRATFRAVGSLRNLEVLEFQATNFTVVPFKAFNGAASKLRVVRFYNPDADKSSTALTTIGTRAFFRANRLEEIDLKNNRISLIKPYAFAFSRPPLPENKGHQLNIFLAGNQLHSESFQPNALLGGNGRNITLYLGGYDGGCNRALATLHQEVFEPFLEENQGNVIDMYGCPLLCDHRMEWLTFRLNHFRSQVRNLECYVHSTSSSRRIISKDNYYHVD